MNLIVVSVFLSMQYITQGGSRLAYLNYSSTWLEANDTCSRCGGRIVTWNDNVSQLVSQMNTKPSTIWIGNYLINNPWIKVKGCVLRENLQNGRIPTPTGFYSIYYNNKEACQTICSSGNVFIIQGNDCICFSEDILHSIENECTQNSRLCKPPCKFGHTPVYIKENIFECDFESDFCRNTHIQRESDISWERRNTFVSTEEDTVLGNKGHFLFLYISNSRIPIGRKSSFDITINLSNTRACLTFHYYIYSDDVVSIFLSNGSDLRKQIWRSNGNKGKFWYTVSVDIQESDVKKISFIGSVERQIFIQPSQIAIDDIMITQGACLKDKTLNCDFEKGLCGWHQSTFDGGDWTMEYADQNQQTGGNFIKTTDSFRQGHVHLFSTDVVPRISTKFCLQFWYKLDYTYSDKWALKVSKKRASEKTFAVEWMTRNVNSNTWKQVNVTITSTEIFLIAFEGVGGDDDGYIYLDEISLRERSCDEGGSSKVHMCTSLDVTDKLIKIEKCSTKKPHLMCDIVNIDEMNKCDAIILKEKDSFKPSTPTTVTANENQTVNSLHLNETTDNAMKQDNRNSALIGFQVAVGILSVIVVIFLVAFTWFLLKTKRHKNNDKIRTDPNVDYTQGAVSNLGYESQEDRNDIRNVERKQEDKDIKNKGIHMQDLTSTNMNDHFKLKNMNNGASVENVENAYIDVNSETNNEEIEHAYYDLKPDINSGYDDVYKEKTDGEYDHIGERDKRRIDFNAKDDQTYAHANPAKNQQNDTYDTAAVASDSAYFVLEPSSSEDRSSHLYDHTLNVQ